MIPVLYQGFCVVENNQGIAITHENTRPVPHGKQHILLKSHIHHLTVKCVLSKRESLTLESFGDVHIQCLHIYEIDDDLNAMESEYPLLLTMTDSVGIFDKMFLHKKDFSEPHFSSFRCNRLLLQIDTPPPVFEPTLKFTKFDLIMEAKSVFWDDWKVGDKKPDNKTVEKWLIERGITSKSAAQIAALIKPDLAVK